MKNHFKNCNTLDEAKTLFRKLCFEFHPDTNGGSDKGFILMYNQFKTFDPKEKREDDTNFNAVDFYNIVKKFECLENVLISFVGSFIWLEDEENNQGSTKRQKETIKTISIKGYNKPQFAFKRKKWYLSPEGYKQRYRSKKTFEEIKITWGSKTYKPQKRKQIAF